MKKLLLNSLEYHSLLLSSLPRDTTCRNCRDLLRPTLNRCTHRRYPILGETKFSPKEVQRALEKYNQRSFLYGDKTANESQPITRRVTLTRAWDGAFLTTSQVNKGPFGGKWSLEVEFGILPMQRITARAALSSIPPTKPLRP